MTAGNRRLFRLSGVIIDMLWLLIWFKSRFILTVGGFYNLTEVVEFLLRNDDVPGL